MSATRLSFLTAAAAVMALVGCAPPSSDPELYLASDKGTFDGRVEHAVLRVQAFSRTGSVGQGVVSFASAAGHFVDSPDVRLVEGFATVTFVCNPDEEEACSGTMRVSASWEGQNTNVQLRVTPSTREWPVNWKVVPTHSLATLLAVAAGPDNSVYAVGTGGTVLRLVADTWQPMASPTTETLTAVAVTSRGTPVIVGEHGTLLVGRSGRLELAMSGFTDEDFTSVSAGSDTSIDVGSLAGHIFHFDGTAMVTSFEMGAPVLSLARGADRMWAGGEGLFGVNEGASWGVTAAPVLARYTVALPAAGKLWAGGARLDNSGGVLIEGPNPWYTTTLDEPVNALAIVPKGDERFAISTNSVYRQIGSGTWHRIIAPAGGRAAVSRASMDLVVVGQPGVSLLRVP